MMQYQEVFACNRSDLIIRTNLLGVSFNGGEGEYGPIPQTKHLPPRKPFEPTAFQHPSIMDEVVWGGSFAL